MTPKPPAVPAPGADVVYERCGEVIQSWRHEQLRCCRRKGHKGHHELSKADQRESSAMWARFMREVFERGAAS